MCLKLKIAGFLSVLCCIGIMMLALPAAGSDDLDMPDFQNGDLLEFQIKSGLIYNFLKYTEWPESDAKGGDLHVCQLGGDSLGGALNALTGRTAQQRQIHVFEIDRIQPAQHECHLVFINRNQEEHLQHTLEMMEGLNILTVSDIAYFSSEGGMVEFVTEQNDDEGHNILLHINNTQIEKAGLRVEDRLLRLAEIVR